MNDDRPFINNLTAELHERATKDWSNPTQLRLLYMELLYRERRAARLLRELIEDRLKGFKEYFPWPTTDVPDGTGSIGEQAFQVQEGLLGFIGYRVGINGVTAQKRRAILEDVYLREIPPVNSCEYMQEWGKPRTAKRLKKLANVLAAFARLAKRNGSTTRAKAISHWEADLEYLKRKFYNGVYSFSWPRTNARPTS